MVVRRYLLTFRLDCLNRSGKDCKAVPSYNEETLPQNRIAYQGTDHMRTNNFSIDNKFRESVPLLRVGGLLRPTRSTSLVSHYSCQANNDRNK